MNKSACLAAPDPFANPESLDLDSTTGSIEIESRDEQTEDGLRCGTPQGLKLEARRPPFP